MWEVGFPPCLRRPAGEFIEESFPLDSEVLDVWPDESSLLLFDDRVDVDELEFDDGGDGSKGRRLDIKWKYSMSLC